MSFLDFVSYPSDDIRRVCIPDYYKLMAGLFAIVGNSDRLAAIERRQPDKPLAPQISRQKLTVNSSISGKIAYLIVCGRVAGVFGARFNDALI